MSERKCNFDPDTPPLEDPIAKLERAFLEEYLKAKGLSLHEVPALPEEIRKPIMTDACRYASTKLAEVEMRSRLINELQD